MWMLRAIFFWNYSQHAQNSEMDLVMYFTVNLAFVNYFDNLVECLDVHILKNWTTREQILPISLEAFEIMSSLLVGQKH